MTGPGSSRRSSLLAGLALGTSALAPDPARAQGSGADFSLEYSAPPECPSRAVFESAVVARSTDSRGVERSRPTLGFEVELAKSSDSFAGTLFVMLPDGTRSRRDASGVACSEVLESLAVIAALSLDGYRAESAVGQTNPAPTGPAPPSTDEPKPPAEPARPVPPAPPASPAGATEADVRAPPPDASEAGSGARFRPLLFAGVAWESAVAPSAPLAAWVGGGLERAPSGLFWPSLRLGLLYTGTSTETAGSVSAEFQLVTGRFAGCALGLGRPGQAALRGCLELDAGALRAEGFGVENASPRWMPWLAAGAGVRGELALLSWLALEAGAGVRFLARRYDLVFRGAEPGGDLVIHDMPLVSFGLGAGLVAGVP